MKSRFASLTLALVLGSSFGFMGCQGPSTAPAATKAELGPAPTTPVATISIPGGMPNSEVKSVVVESFIRRRWDILDDGDQMEKAQLIHRGYDATLTATWNDSTIQITSDSYRINKAGEPTERAEPEGWIANLEKDINVRLETAAYID